MGRIFGYTWNQIQAAQQKQEFREYSSASSRPGAIVAICEQLLAVREAQMKPVGKFVLEPSEQRLPAVLDFGSLTKLIVQKLIGYTATDDVIADAETFVYNACRTAMLPKSVS